MDALYCIHCWAELPAGATMCPDCGRPINDATADITDKYIAALRHPQAETRLRVVWMLGRMQAVRAVPALLQIVRTRGQGDPYLLSAAVQSLGQIGDERVMPVLRELLNDQTAAIMAQVQAANALSRMLSVHAQKARPETAMNRGERRREASNRDVSLAH